jgi:membrane-bound metal-dependent hydrolase YbcI (DUF457 family)
MSSENENETRLRIPIFNNLQLGRLSPPTIDSNELAVRAMRQLAEDRERCNDPCPMPTPVGHAIGGLAAAWLTESATGKLSSRSWSRMLLAAACAAAAVSPDLDLLVGHHRTYTHSIGAVAAAGAVAWLFARRRRELSSGAHPPSRGESLRPGIVAVAVAAAYASHLLLDWLGKDSSNPPGLTALWPFSSRFYISGANVFGEVSRRYWKPEEFIVGNFLAVGRELLILVPIAALAYALAARRLAGTHHQTNN